MASIDKIGRIDADSEMEEGEIVDELDDLSDISSEEEFLLRQRLEVLENYNNVLERKKKKHTSGSKLIHDLSWDLSEISAAEIDEPKLCSTKHTDKTQKHVKQHSKQRRRKELNQKSFEVKHIKRKRDHRKKNSLAKKKLEIKPINESSDESEDEYRNKRQKLADAVKGHRKISDTSSLSARLKKMLHKSEEKDSMENDILNIHKNNNNQMGVQLSLHNLETVDELDCGKLKINVPKEYVETQKLCEPIDLLSTDDDDVDDDVKLITDNDRQLSVSNNLSAQMPATIEPTTQQEEKDSDEDLAKLRQQVLSSKTLKAKITQKAKPETKIASEDEDSDTTELRLICLKSALLKRAIEMKQKQKLQKKLSQSTLEDDILNENILFPTKIDSGNNTDIESVDMDMESDIEERTKDGKNYNIRQKKSETNDKKIIDNHSSAIHDVKTSKEDELEEDEDLLRAKLLTSLSKNLPNLVSPEILNTIEETKVMECNVKKQVAVKVPEEKRFIIELDESDSEGEHEATKNLTKMHMKLSEQSDFQQKLDLFLKSTRMAVENPKLPDVIQNPMLPKKPEKFVAKAVNHLPKSEQIEYKNLVKRMAELEKMKQSRQSLINTASLLSKDTKPRNVTSDINIEEKISLSRKKIADESAKMLKLKEEATKLSQKYKIVATELHNISTAITLNKKQQRAVQNCLSKIRQQHQSLLKSSTTSLRSKVNSHFNNFTNKVATTTKSQNEKNLKNDYKNPLVQKSVKVSVVNDLNNENKAIDQRISIEVNVANNQKIVKMPSPVKERLVEVKKTTENEALNSVDRDIEVTKTAEIEGMDILETVIDINKNVEKEVLNRLEEVINVKESSKIEIIPGPVQDGKVLEYNEKVETNKLVKESIEVIKKSEQLNETINNIEKEINRLETLNSCPDVDKHSTDYDSKSFAVSDYKSPLEAFGTMLWKSDPNAILCPFEVGGQCKDPDCKYLHTDLSKQ